MPAIAYFVFNRPEHTRRSFAAIRNQKPSRLFIIADGPRADAPGDEDLCASTRAVLDNIDWECDVRRAYSDRNLGLRARFTGGLEWVFSQTETAIVLEDDCVATPDFFSFCATLLNRYADEPRVMSITGDNFQNGIQRGKASYYFSKYSHVWGWATWRRAWSAYDSDLSFWPDWQLSEGWRTLMPDPVERHYWESLLERVKSGELNTWDYQWTASIWQAGGVTAIPNVNLVENIGFGPEATNTKFAGSAAVVPAGYLATINHPEHIEVCIEADQFTFEAHYGRGRTLMRRMAAGVARVSRFAPIQVFDLVARALKSVLRSGS